jgi:Biotin-lipoyl like
MNPAYLPAIAALAGSAIGGLTSLASTWLSQSRQNEVDATGFDIAAWVDGRVANIPVARGQNVAAGAVLVRVDNPETIAKNEQALAARFVSPSQRRDLGRTRHRRVHCGSPCFSTARAHRQIPPQPRAVSIERVKLCSSHPVRAVSFVSQASRFSSHSRRVRRPKSSNRIARRTCHGFGNGPTGQLRSSCSRTGKTLTD